MRNLKSLALLVVIGMSVGACSSSNRRQQIAGDSRYWQALYGSQQPAYGNNRGQVNQGQILQPGQLAQDPRLLGGNARGMNQVMMGNPQGEMVYCKGRTKAGCPEDFEKPAWDQECAKKKDCDDESRNDRGDVEVASNDGDADQSRPRTNTERLGEEFELSKTPRHERICEAENQETKRGIDWDGDSIKQKCDNYLVELGYELAGDSTPNGYLVTAKKLNVEALKEKIKTLNAGVTDQGIKDAIQKILDNKTSFWAKLGLSERMVQLNALLIARLVVDQMMNGGSSDKVIKDLLESSTNLRMREPDVKKLPEGFVLPEDPKVDGPTVTVLRGGPGSRALILDPREKQPPFKVSDLNGVFRNLKNLSDDDAFIYVAEAWVNSGDDLTLTVARMGRDIARAAGVFLVFVDDEIAVHSIDVNSQGVDKKLKNALGELKPYSESDSFTSGKTRHLVVAMVGQQIPEKSPDAGKFVMENVFARFGDGKKEFLPQEIATYIPPDGETSILGVKGVDLPDAPVETGKVDSDKGPIDPVVAGGNPIPSNKVNEEPAEGTPSE